MRGFLRAAAAVFCAVSQLRPSEAHSTSRNPLKYITRIDDPVLHSASHRVHAFSSFDLTFALHQGHQPVRLVLQPNHDVLSDTASIQHLGPDGTVTHVEPIVRTDHKVFKGDAFIKHPGHSEWTNVGWARIMVHRDGVKPLFEGVFRIHGDHHHVQTSAAYRQTRIQGDPEAEYADDEYMTVWRDSDISLNPWDVDSELKRGIEERSPPTCSSDGLTFNNEFRGLDLRDTAGISTTSLFGRDIDGGGTTGGNSAGVNLSSTIGNTAGCPTTRKVALVGIATDCTYTAQFNSTQSARSNIISVVNSASAVYESSFNITLGIQNLTTSDSSCPGTASASAPWNVACGNLTITDRLNLFSAWRGQFNDTNAYWTLMSTCNTDAAVGLAWLGQACLTGSQTSATSGSSTNETIAAANVVVRTSTEWQVFAHESGHTFGAVHDCTSQTCADGTVTQQQCCPLSTTTCNANGKYIMNPSTGSGITQFSPCSIGNICSAIGRNSVRTTCLTNNKDVTTITGSECGNGIVESGEDCDCGGTASCGNNPCCDPTTCKFKTNAVCDPSNEDCCSSTCQFATNGTVCRASTGSCDPQEVCSGKSATCPLDSTAPNGQSCGTSGAGLTCASGQCTSRDLQCKTLMGSLTNSNDTYACNSQTCQLSCASSSLAANTCYNMNQNFLDGTPCSGGGQCNNGQCVGSSWTNEVSSWINDNKNIVIPVVSVVGALVLIAIASCIFSCCRRRRRRNAAPKLQRPNPNWTRGYPGNGGVVQPPQAMRSTTRVPAPPAMPSTTPFQQQQSWNQSRGISMRYA